MAVPIGGYEFLITSIGGSSDLTQLLANTKVEGTANLTINGAALVAGHGDNAIAVVGGLYDWEVSWDWLFPASPQIGYELFFTMASSYATRPRSFTVNMNADEFDITEATATGNPISRSFMPGLWNHTFNYTCLVDDTTVTTPPTSPAVASEAAVFKLTEEGGTDHQLTGNVVINQYGLPISRQGVMEVTYGGTVDGDLTVVSPSTDGFLPDGVIDTPDWEGSGTPDVLFSGVLVSGQTFAGNVFGRSHTITATLGELLRGTTVARGIGDITFA